MGIIETKLDGIKEDTTEIKDCVFGNGTKGLKARVIILEVKWWVLLILSFVLITPISIESMKRLLGYE